MKIVKKGLGKTNEIIKKNIELNISLPLYLVISYYEVKSKIIDK